MKTSESLDGHRNQSDLIKLKHQIQVAESVQNLVNQNLFLILQYHELPSKSTTGR